MNETVTTNFFPEPCFVNGFDISFVDWYLDGTHSNCSIYRKNAAFIKVGKETDFLLSGWYSKSVLYTNINRENEL